MGEINLNEFFKKYSEEEIEELKSIIKETMGNLNDNNIEETVETLSKNKYVKYPEIQYYRVNLLIRLKKYGKAYNIASNSSFEPLQVIAKDLKKKLTELEPKKKNYIQESINIFSMLYPKVDRNIVEEELNKLLYEDNVDIYNLLIKIEGLSNDEILKQVSNDTYSKFYLAQFIRIKALLDTKTPSNIKKGGNLLKSYLNKPLFKTLINSEQEKKEEQKESIINENISKQLEEKVIDESNMQYSKNILYTKLYIGNITLEDINNSNLNEDDKIIFTIGYYEKYNKKRGILYIKEQKKKYSNEPEKLKILNIFMNNMISKKGVLDLHLYHEYLKAEILFDEIDKLTTTEKSEMVKVKEVKKKEEVKTQVKEKKEVKYVTSSMVVTPTKVKTSKNKKNKGTITIEQALAEDIIPIETYIYSKMYPPMFSKIITSNEFQLFHQADIPKSEMKKLSSISKKYVQVLSEEYTKQRDAIKAWDYFYNLVSKSIDDEDALLKVICIIEKFQTLGTERTGIELPVDVKVYRKYMK